MADPTDGTAGGRGPSGLTGSESALREAYDVAVLDLDGVVYRGPEAVPGAAEALNDAQGHGMHLAFVTNNASRTPDAVGDRLRGFGVRASDDDVVTSAQAAARLLASQLEEGAPVLLVGGTGLEQALRERGLRPVTSAEEEPVAVAQGYGPDVPWARISLGAELVRSGITWVASNTDMTIPTERGVAPGNGAMVRLVAEFAGREPQVAGKPESPLFEETLRRVGGSRPLVVGDRLDTDIEGAVRMGWDSLLVLTGVSGLEDLLAAPPSQRPSFLAPDLAALAHAQPAVQADEDGARCGGWRASTQGGRLEVQGEGDPGDWWRAVTVAGWAHLDEHGQPVATDGLRPPE